MKPTQIKDLQKHVVGQITTASSALDYYSTDGSVFTIRPAGAFFPHNTDDVRAVVAQTAIQLAKGKTASLIGRGNGTDQGGGALGDGVMVVFPAHMNKLIRLSKDRISVQPGINYGALQKVLHSHGRFLPPYPSSLEYSSVGGAVANNASGEKTLKYGSTRNYVEGLRVVLSDGSVIETRRISSRELNRKKGQMTLEGDIYRGIDSLIIDNKGLINKAGADVSKNAAGYALGKVKRRDGSFDLGQLIVGAQGTLGLVTEVTLRTLPYNPRTSLVVGYFESLDDVGEAVLRLRKLGPSAMELVDYHLLAYLRKNRPESIENVVPDCLPKAILLVEFDNGSQWRQNVLARKAAAILKNSGSSVRVATSSKEQDALWQIRRNAAAYLWMNPGKGQALPIIEDACVPVEKLPEFMTAAYKLLGKHKLEAAIWGHAGDGNFHIQPLMDLSKPKERQKVFAVMDDFYNLVIKMGGTTSGEHNDGLLRAPYLEKLYGADMYELFEQVKKICDPKGVFNPRVKLGVKKKYLQVLLRHEYSMKHLYDHFPQT